MDIAATIRWVLENDSAVGALVGTRIYPVYAPLGDEDATVPNLLVYRMISWTEENPVKAPLGLLGARWQVISMADSYDTARQIDRAVRAALAYKKGIPTAGAVQIEKCHPADARDGDVSSDLNAYAVEREFDFTWKEN